MTSSFIIENINLGTKLDDIKNNKPIFNTPVVLSASTTLSVRQFLQIIQNGLLVDITNGNITITFPTAPDIQSAFPFQKYQQFTFNINAFALSLPNANALTILGNTGVTLAEPIVLTAQKTNIFSFTCYNTSPLSFVIY